MLYTICTAVKHKVENKSQWVHAGIENLYKKWTGCIAVKHKSLTLVKKTYYYVLYWPLYTVMHYFCSPLKCFFSLYTSQAETSTMTLSPIVDTSHIQLSTTNFTQRPFELTCTVLGPERP